MALSKLLDDAAGVALGIATKTAPGLVEGAIDHAMKLTEDHLPRISALVIPRRKNLVLFGRKRNYDAGKQPLSVGKWNAFGGGAETPEERSNPALAGVRELEEEVGLIVRPEHLNKRAYFQMCFLHNRALDRGVHVFETWEFQGEPRASEEMDEPTWWHTNNLPFGEMWAGDTLWMPRVLAGECLTGEISYVETPSGLMVAKAKFVPIETL